MKPADVKSVGEVLTMAEAVRADEYERQSVFAAQIARMLGSDDATPDKYNPLAQIEVGPETISMDEAIQVMRCHKADSA